MGARRDRPTNARLATFDRPAPYGELAGHALVVRDGVIADGGGHGGTGASLALTGGKVVAHANSVTVQRTKGAHWKFGPDEQLDLTDWGRNGTTRQCDGGTGTGASPKRDGHHGDRSSARHRGSDSAPVEAKMVRRRSPRRPSN